MSFERFFFLLYFIHFRDISFVIVVSLIYRGLRLFFFWSTSVIFSEPQCSTELKRPFYVGKNYMFLRACEMASFNDFKTIPTMNGKWTNEKNGFWYDNVALIICAVWRWEPNVIFQLDSKLSFRQTFHVRRHEEGQREQPDDSKLPFITASTSIPDPNNTQIETNCATCERKIGRYMEKTEKTTIITYKMERSFFLFFYPWRLCVLGQSEYDKHD